MIGSLVSALSLNRLLALIAIILAFPPVFSRQGYTEGLLMSLSLVTFYSLRGLLSLADISAFSKSSAVRPSQFFAFTEIPAIFASVYFGLKTLPEWLAFPYQWTLLASSPLFVLLEGISSMVIILECGERCSDALGDSSNSIKALVATICFGVFGVSFYMINEIYLSGLLSIASARYKYIISFISSFIASVCTILIGLTALTIFVEHGTITDAAMLCLYVTYNIWCVTRSWKEQFMSAVRIESVFDYFISPSKLFGSVNTSHLSILASITSLASMFSVEIVVHLMIQMCVFVIAVKLIGRAIRNQGRKNGESEDMENEDSWLSYQDWIFNVLWPSFGKLILVLVYTYAWILHTQPELVLKEWSWYNPITWRYVNVVMILLIYLKHLLTPPDEPVLCKID